jgi:hypothetical protein
VDQRRLILWEVCVGGWNCGERVVDVIVDVGADENITMDLRYEIITTRD